MKIKGVRHHISSCRCPSAKAQKEGHKQSTSEFFTRRDKSNAININTILLHGIHNQHVIDSYSFSKSIDLIRIARQCDEAEVEGHLIRMSERVYMNSLSRYLAGTREDPNHTIYAQHVQLGNVVDCKQKTEQCFKNLRILLVSQNLSLFPFYYICQNNHCNCSLHDPISG